MNLIEHFDRIHRTEHGELSSALAVMSAALGHVYDIKRFGQWRRGAVPVPAHVQAYMRAIVLTDIHSSCSATRFNRAVLAEILAACEPPTAATEAGRPFSLRQPHAPEPLGF